MRSGLRPGTANDLVGTWLELDAAHRGLPPGSTPVAADRMAERWDEDPHVTATARRAGAVSLVLWSATIISGRLIAYNWFG